MKYKRLQIPKDPKILVDKIMDSEDSWLIIPPYYRDKNPEIGKYEGEGKFVGLFSSGTTGTPKCIWNAFDNLINNALNTRSAFEIEPRHRLLILASPWHVAGLSWALMAEHYDNEYQFIATQKGDEKKWYEAIQQFKPDVLLTVPAVLNGLLDFKWDVPKIVFGGTPLEPKELISISERCVDLFQGYGQTEAGGLITVYKYKNLPDVINDEHRCCGRPIKGVDLRCNGTINKPEPILVRSKTAYTDDFYETGDLGYKDEERNLYIHSRINRPVKNK
jgi:acyl-coenzyme A synthetase/AMP-(fatty) acid ligase